MLALAYVLVAIPIALLAVYGADVAATTALGEGFLDIDHRVRGLGLGLPSMVLPFVAYVVSRKDRSAGLGAMIIAAGVLIVAGGAFILAAADPQEGAEAARDPVMEAAPLIAVGAAMAALGAFKAARSRAVGAIKQ